MSVASAVVASSLVDAEKEHQRALSKRARMVRAVADELAASEASDADMQVSFCFYIVDSHGHMQAGTEAAMCSAVIPISGATKRVMRVNYTPALVHMFTRAVRANLRAVMRVQLFGYDEPDVHAFEQVNLFDTDTTNSRIEFRDTTARDVTLGVQQPCFAIDVEFLKESGCVINAVRFTYRELEHDELSDLLQKESRRAHAAEMMALVASLETTQKRCKCSEQ